MDRDLRRAIIGAFDLAGLAKLCADYLPQKIDMLAAPGTLDDQAYAVVDKCSQHGWTGLLLAGVVSERPDKLVGGLGRAAAAVRCVGTVRQDEQPRGAGFLVGPDLVLTSDDVGTTPTFVLDNRVFTATVEILRPAPDGLGFALLRLSEEASPSQWLAVPSKPYPFAKCKGAAILQRPEGAPTAFVMAAQPFVASEDGRRVEYQLPADGATAGAPVFSTDDWALVALHRSQGGALPLAAIGADAEVRTKLPTRKPGAKVPLTQRQRRIRAAAYAAALIAVVAALFLGAWMMIRDPSCVAEVSWHQPSAIDEWHLIVSTGSMVPWTLDRALERTRDGEPDDSRLSCTKDVIAESRAIASAGYDGKTESKYFSVTPRLEPFVFPVSSATTLDRSDGTGAQEIPVPPGGRAVVAVGLIVATVETTSDFTRCMNDLASKADYVFPDEFLIGALAVVEVSVGAADDELADGHRLDFAGCRLLHGQHAHASCSWACSLLHDEPEDRRRRGDPPTVIGVKFATLSL